MNILVTGGCGYVGSIVAEELIRDGHNVIILDNLQQGHVQAVPPGARFVKADICDAIAQSNVFQQSNIDAVMHMAAETLVEFSMTDPRRYFYTNILGGMTVLDTMVKYNVHKIVFSSTAAVYGEPQNNFLSEDHPKNPINSYGESKLMFERILSWYGKAYGLKHISLRYFNAAGSTELLGEDHRPETHLIPNVLKAALHKNDPVHIFGTDYQTKDGSCIRDYVHVSDIARAHILALNLLEGLSGKAYNLGNGEGYSVLEVLQMSRRITGVNIPSVISPRREGDPATLVASSKLARQELGWEPQCSDLANIIESSWKWLVKHNDGYEQ